MTWQLTLIVFFGLLMFALLSGMALPAAFMAISGTAAFIFWGGFSGLEQMSLTLLNTVKTWSLLPIPLFILMGEILFQTGIMKKALDVVDMWMGKLPGRLAIVGVLSSVLMGTFTGSSMAATSMLSTALVPEMKKRGYATDYSLGSICGAGGLAMMIPPSSLAVTVATIAGASVSKTLIGAIVPGLLMAAGYVTYIIGRAIIRPQDAPSYEAEKKPLKERLIFTAVNILPIFLIIFSVSGVILFGLCTPSEAAACGVVASIIVTMCMRTLTLGKLKQALLNTTRTSAMLLSIMMGSGMFSSILSFSGATKALTTAVAGLNVSPKIIVFCFMLVVFVLGCFMETNSIMLITLPIFIPVITALGFDKVWFVLIMMVSCEMAESTPPFGVLLFLLKGLFPKEKMSMIIKAAVPYLCADFVAMMIMFFFPAVALWLPSVVK